MPGLLSQGQTIQPTSTNPLKYLGPGPGPGPGGTPPPGFPAVSNPQAIDPSNPQPGAITGPNPDKTLGKSNPLPGQNYLPQNFSDLYNSQLTRTPDWYASTLNYGVGQPNVPFNAEGSGQAGSNDPMLAAIQGQAQRNYGNASRSLQVQNAAAAAPMASAEETVAAKEMGAEYANDVQNFNQQYQYELQRQNLFNEYNTAVNQTTAQVMGQIFQGVGALGMAAAG